jgi:uncharacterized MAPEG superfamily protein
VGVVLVSVAIYLHSKYPYQDKPAPSMAAPGATTGSAAGAEKVEAAASRKGKEATPALTAAAVDSAGAKGRKRD